MQSIEDARKLQFTYRPTDQATLARLKQITLYPIVGATAVGKNFIIDNIPAHMVGTITTREKQARDDRSKYRYLTNKEFLTWLTEGKIVQYAAHPVKDVLYGTDIHDYASGANIGDYYAEIITSLRYLYGSFRPVYVTCEPKEWERRLEERFAHAPKYDISGRLDEAEISLKLAIKGWPGLGVLYVDNTQANTETTMQSVKDYMDNTATIADNELNKQVCHRMLESIPNMRSKFLS